MTVRQAANALQVLEYFAERLRPATAAEMADDLGWPRSSTFKLIGTLAAMGYLYEPQGRGGYYPSPRWLELSDKVTRADPLPAVLHKLVREVQRETGETTAIAAPAGTFAMFVDVAESPQRVRYFAQVGERVPIHATSVGRALMAQMAPDERQSLYRRIEFQRYADRTPMSSDAVENELLAATQRGYHQSHADHTPDLAGIAFPLTGASRRLSIVVVGPASRCLDHRPELATIVQRYIAKLLPLG